MRVMVFVKATEDSEVGAAPMPSRSRVMPAPPVLNKEVEPRPAGCKSRRPDVVDQYAISAITPK